MDQPTTRSIDTASGPVQFVDSGGTGSPVLFVHGTPGGCDQGELMGRFLAERGARVIAPSRPGYLDTPLSDTVASPAQQAQLHAALLDALDIDRVALACWSGGGPSSYQLAIDLGDRVTSMAAVAAVSGAYTFDHPAEESILFGRPGAWLVREMVRHAPHSTVRSLVTEEGELTKDQAKELVEAIWSDEATRTWVLDWAGTVSGARRTGFANDRQHFDDLELDLASVSAPVLLVHADTDSDVPITHSEDAVRRLPRAEMLVVAGGTHISAWTGPDLERTRSRLADHLLAAS